MKREKPESASSARRRLRRRRSASSARRRRKNAKKPSKEREMLRMPKSALLTAPKPLARSVKRTKRSRMR